MTSITHAQLLAHLTRLENKYGTRKALADRMNVPPGYLSDVMNGNREPGEKFLKPLGLKRVTYYEKR